MYLTIDLGGTNIKAGIFEHGVMRSYYHLPAFSDQGIEQALVRITRQVKNDGYNATAFSCFGIATPGIVDVKKKRVLSINKKYPDAVDFVFTDWCRQQLGCEVIMENDANAALYGEVHTGCAKGEKNVVMMTVGTGIGTSVMINGGLLRGAHYQGGILGGHFVGEIDGAACSCGGWGCLETLGGSRELGIWAVRQPGFLHSSLAAETVIDMKAVINGREAGDPFCNQVFERMMDIYSVVVVNLVHAYDPSMIVLSGGVLKAKDQIIPAMAARVEERAWMPWGSLQWETAKNPDHSVLYGLYALMEENCETNRNIW